MSSLKDKIAFNAGVKSRKEYITESTASSKKEMYVMQRVLNIVSNCVNDIENLKYDLNSPNQKTGIYYGPQATDTPSVSPEELVAIKKKAYALLMSKMSLVAETIKEVFGVEDEKEEKEESGSENDEE